MTITKYLAILWLFILLTACAPTPGTFSPVTATKTGTPQPPDTATPMPSATITATYIPTASITPTPSPTFTPTPTLKLPVSQGTPMPSAREMITRDNVGRLSMLASWDYPQKCNYSLSFSQKGDSLAFSCNWQAAIVYNVNNGDVVYQQDVSDEVGFDNVVLSPNGSMLAIAKQRFGLKNYLLKKEIHIVRVPGGEVVNSFIHPDSQEGYGAPSFSVDGTLIGAVSSNHVVNIWKVADWSQIASFKAGNATRVLFPDDKTVISEDGSHTTRWDLLSGKRSVEYMEPESIRADLIALSPSGDRLAVASHYGYGDVNSTEIWSVSDGELIDRFSKDYYIIDMAFTPNNDLLFSLNIVYGESSPRLRVRDLRNGTFMEEWAGVEAFALSPTGDLLAFVRDGQIQLWGLPEH